MYVFSKLLYTPYQGIWEFLLFHVLTSKEGCVPLSNHSLASECGMVPCCA